MSARRALAVTLALVGVLLAARATRADAPADLTLYELPPRGHGALAMRQSRTGDAPPLAARAAPGRAAPGRAAPPTSRDRELVVGEGREPLDERIVFRLNLGWGIDGGEPDQGLLTGGAPLGQSYDRVRIINQGDVVLGTRGLALSSLSTYLAANYYFQQSFDRPASPLPSVYDARDADNVLVRVGYAQLEELSDQALLAPLYVRAGRQFRFGPAVAHFDGLTLGYDTDAVKLGVFAGQQVRRYDYAPSIDQVGEPVPHASIAGADLRVDLFALRGTPLVLSSSLLRHEGRSHSRAALALRWNPDMLIEASARFLGADVARQTLSVRLRVSDVTTVNAELDNRTADDWLYDLFLLAAPTGAQASVLDRLNIGPVVPRLHANVHAGTVLLDNVDVLLRAGGAVERADEGDETSFAAAYLEAGAAVELRLRRTLGLGLAAMVRDFRRAEPLEVTDTPDVPDPLFLSTADLGEHSFGEGVASIRYTTGARQFSALIELYARGYRLQSRYVAPEDEERDIHGGGRFTVDGWISERLRLRLLYDVSSALRFAPELRGVKRMRVMAEGQF